MTNNDIQGNKQIFLATVEPLSPLDLQDWTFIALHIATKAGLATLKTAFQQYPNDGLTITVFLAESHITIDTYPENNLAEINLSCCKYFDVHKVRSAIASMKLWEKNYTNLVKQDDNSWVVENQ